MIGVAPAEAVAHDADQVRTTGAIGTGCASATNKVGEEYDGHCA